MKTNIFVATTLLVLSTPNVFAFDNQLPARITCDAKLYCKSDDPKYKHEGWSFYGQGTGYLKAGEYIFQEAIMMGDPYDPFIKNVSYKYKMIDEKGFEYEAQYSANNWIIPIHIENWVVSTSLAYCQNTAIENCYIQVIDPPPPPGYIAKNN